jgi:hypothetical protein
MSFLLCFSWMDAEAQDQVSIHYPFGLTKISMDNGKTWEEKQNKNVTFNYPFQIKKVSTNNGKTWKVSELGKITISYPNGFSKISYDKGKTWVIDRLGHNMVNELSAYPVPAVDYVELETSNFNLETVPELLDLSGRAVKLPNGSDFVSSEKYHLNTSDLENGYYIIRFETNDGPATTKILIQN